MPLRFNGAEMRRLRKGKKLSLRKFGELLGRNPVTVGDYETDPYRPPPDDMIDLIAHHLETDKIALMTDKPIGYTEEAGKKIVGSETPTAPLDKLKAAIMDAYDHMGPDQAVKLFQFSKDILAGKDCHCHDGETQVGGAAGGSAPLGVDTDTSTLTNTTRRTSDSNLSVPVK